MIQQNKRPLCSSDFSSLKRCSVVKPVSKSSDWIQAGWQIPIFQMIFRTSLYNCNPQTLQNIVNRKDVIVQLELLLNILQMKTQFLKIFNFHYDYYSWSRLTLSLINLSFG
jgi:hypothetical protein